MRGYDGPGSAFVHAGELRAAIELFDRIGAEPWAEQATAELAATGETARRRDVSTVDALTPQELQIGLLLAEGRTTREAAATLFLSPKTVEYHLRHIYRKLDINSREALSTALKNCRDDSRAAEEVTVGGARPHDLPPRRWLSASRR